MTSATAHGTKLNASLFAALFIVLAVALGGAGFDLYFRTPMLEVGDTALNALRIDNAKHFSELYGNYSRFEFSHPGPALFYVYAAGELNFHDLLGLAPSPANAHLLACMLTQVFFFTLALAILASHVPWRTVLPLALIVAAVHFGRQLEPFMSIWPPHVLTMPFLGFLLAAISVATGRVNHTVPMVLAGGFLFHGHVAQPLFVGSLGALAFVICWRRLRTHDPRPLREHLRDRRRTLLTCGALIALFLLPLAIDVLTLGTKSNVATIFGRFYANTDDSKTPFQSLLYFLSFATDARNQGEIFDSPAPATHAFFAAHAARITGGVVLLLLPLILAWFTRRRDDPPALFLKTAGVFLAATLLLCVLWGMAQAGPMEHFNGYFYYGVYYVAALLLIARFAPALDRFSSPLTAASLGAIAAALFAVCFHQTPRTEAEAGLPEQQGIRAALAADASPKPKLLVFEHAHWPTAAGVALELQRDGIGYYVTPWWEFMFDRRHDTLRLGKAPEDQTSVWWLTAPGPGGIPVTPELSLFTTPAPITPAGDAITLSGGANGFRYVVSGVTAGNVEHAWTNEPRTVFVFAPQKSTGDVRMTLDAQSHTRDASGAVAQPADIFFNGRHLGQVSASERAEIPVIIPAALWNERPTAKLELRFPGARPKSALKRPRYQVWFAWGLWKIRFDQNP